MGSQQTADEPRPCPDSERQRPAAPACCQCAPWLPLLSPTDLCGQGPDPAKGSSPQGGSAPKDQHAARWGRGRSALSLGPCPSPRPVVQQVSEGSGEVKEWGAHCQVPGLPEHGGLLGGSSPVSGCSAPSAVNGTIIISTAGRKKNGDLHGHGSQLQLGQWLPRTAQPEDSVPTPENSGATRNDRAP